MASHISALNRSTINASETALTTARLAPAAAWRSPGQTYIVAEIRRHDRLKKLPLNRHRHRGYQATPRRQESNGPFGGRSQNRVIVRTQTTHGIELVLDVIKRAIEKREVLEKEAVEGRGGEVEVEEASGEAGVGVVEPYVLRGVVYGLDCEIAGVGKSENCLIKCVTGEVEASVAAGGGLEVLEAKGEADYGLRAAAEGGGTEFRG